MLAEQLVKIEGLKLVQMNTDGILIYIKKEKVEEARKVADDWMDLTGLSLDFDYFDFIAQADINNYIGKYKKNGYIKAKGRFELKKDMHKDHSSMIIPLAIAEYFSNNTPIEEFITNHTNIYDFMIRTEVMKGWKMEYVYACDDGTLCTDEMPSMLRLYVSKGGGKLFRVKPDDSKVAFKKRYNITPMNIIHSENIEDYDIDYAYYIQEAKKEIEALEESPQLSLF